MIASELKKRNLDVKFEVVSNPEFLKEGAAVEDFLKPDRVVVGASSEWGQSVMGELYAPFMKNHDRFIAMDVKSAEMTKYAANAMLATKISFINEIAGICERVGADVNLVRKGIGSDSRIGYSFIYPGCGYGGSCFPKDVEALIYTARQNGFEPELLNAVESRNKAQKRVLFEKIYNFFGGDLKGKTIALWGLAFKPNTDDMREASSLTLIKLLDEAGAKVVAYDPKASEEAKKYMPNLDVKYAKNKYTLGIAIDGPGGPVFEPKSGAIFIAKKTGMPIVPVSSYCSKKWIFKNMWDKLEIPMPFSRCVHYVAEPFYLSKETSLEESTELVKKRIHDAGYKAFEIYNKKYNKNSHYNK